MPNVADSILFDGSVPASPAVGTIWYDSTTGKVMVQKASGAVEISTPGSAGGGGLVQTAYDERTTDYSMSSSNYDEILSATLTTFGGALVIHFTSSFQSSSANRFVYTRMKLDGVVVSGCVTQVGASSNTYGNCSLIKKIPVVSAAQHTISVEWCVSSGTLRCRPWSQTEDEHASLLVSEVSV